MHIWSGAVAVAAVAVATVGLADSGPSGHVVVEADMFFGKEEDTITWL